MTRRPRARRGEGDRLRAEILDAAGRLLAATGDEAAVSIRAVAEAVGVTAPSIYLHFPDKDALLAAVCEVRFREFDERLEKAAAGAADPVDGLRLRGREYVRFGLENPEHYRILFMTRSEHGPGDAGHEAGATAFAHLVEAVQRAIDAKALVAEDATLVAISLWSTLHGMTSLMVSMPEFPWPADLADRVVELQLAGLRRRRRSS